MTARDIANRGIMTGCFTLKTIKIKSCAKSFEKGKVQRLMKPHFLMGGSKVQWRLTPLEVPRVL